jgi:hypothetical protein
MHTPATRFHNYMSIYQQVKWNIREAHVTENVAYFVKDQKKYIIRFSEII